MLKTIALEGTKVSKISISGDCCPFLETLRLYGNKDLRDLEALPATLKTISVTYCNVLKDIRGVHGLKNLQNLAIKKCEELDGLPCFGELVSLQIFTLQGSNKVKKIAGLQGLRSLRELRIELDERPSLAELTSLKLFELQQCHKLEKIEGLGNLRSLETLRIHDCPELDGLPSLSELTSLKEFDLRMCHKLEKVDGLELWRSLETLEISDCPELYRLPSLAELTYLREFDLTMCNKLEKIKGLERLKSLEKLKLHTRWKAPCMVKWEQCERLKSLVVVANDRSAVEPFISNIQKWPREVMICTRAVFDVSSLKSLLEELPNVSVLHYSDGVKDAQWLELRRPESSANANAILICYIIDCVYPDLHLIVHRRGFLDFKTELGKGKWVWMGVFTQASDWLGLKEEYIGAVREGTWVKGGVKVEEAWLVKGEEGSIVEGFSIAFPEEHYKSK